MRGLVQFGVIGVLAGGGMIASAQAQDNFYSRDKYVAVTDRPQPEFDPEPVRLGALIVNARGEASVRSTSNVFASSADEQSDTIARIGVGVDGHTNWSNHEIGLTASAHRDNHTDFSDDSNNDLRLALRGRLDVSRNLDVTARAFTEDRAEPRTEYANAIGLEEPVGFNRTGGGLDANYNADRLRWLGTVEIAEFDYEDGQIAGSAIAFDQDFRDRTNITGRTRLTYAVSPDFAVFGQAGAYKSEFDAIQTVGLVQRNRDNEGYTLEAGANFELQALIRGDIAVGFFSEDKADPAFVDVDGLSVDGRLQWFPTRLTTVGLQASRRTVDLGLIEAPTALQTGLGARVDHELRRNIILSAFTNFSQNEYDDIDRSEDVSEFGVQGVYKLNKRVHTEAFVRHLARDVSGAGVLVDQDYTVDFIGVGLRLFP